MGRQVTSKQFRCLLVESDDDQAELVQRALSDFHGNLVFVRVSTGAEALAMLKATGKDKLLADLVLLGLKLEGVGGHEILATIKEDQTLGLIPVVILTSSQEEHDRKRAYQLMANSYFVKPKDFDQFKRMIQDILRYWISWNAPPPAATSPRKIRGVV